MVTITSHGYHLSFSLSNLLSRWLRFLPPSMTSKSLDTTRFRVTHNGEETCCLSQSTQTFDDLTVGSATADNKGFILNLNNGI